MIHHQISKQLASVFPALSGQSRGLVLVLVKTVVMILPLYPQRGLVLTAIDQSNTENVNNEQ